MIKITAPPTPSDATFQRVLDAMPSGDSWVKGNVIPYAEPDGVVLVVEADVDGTEVQISQDGKVTTRFVPSARTTTVTLALRRGYNTVTARQGLNVFQTQLVATEYAIFLRAFADEVYASVERDIEAYEQHFASYFSIRMTEHQMAFSDLMPGALAYRTLLGKMAIRSLVNETATTRGVDDITTAVTVSTPYVEVTRATTDPSAPNPQYTSSQHFGGFKVHYWAPNTCLASWYGFTRLLSTLADDDLHLVSASDAKVVVHHQGQDYTHLFDTESASCSDLTDVCALESHVWVRTTSITDIYLCAWSQPFDVAVSLPLGRSGFDEGRLDTGRLLDSRAITVPLDAWMWLPLTNRFDGGSCLDSTVGSNATTLEDLCCSSAALAVVSETMVDVEVDARPGIFASMVVIPA